MAINWTEARIEEVVAEVIKSLGGAPEKKVGWDSTQYNGRKFIGVFADMNDAIDAATAGYKVIRAMSLEEREKVISAIRELCRKEASVMAELGVAETKMGRVEHKTAKHILVADKTPGTADIVMFNFGWLPGADHAVFSTADSIPALEAALHGEQLQPVLLGQRERAMAFQPGQNVVY